MTRKLFIDAVSSLDGRSDQGIQSYYVETNALRRIRDSDVSSIGIVGLKGSGKSTLFRLLTEKWAWEPRTIRVGLAPDRSEFEAYTRKLSCLQFANSVKQGLPLLLLQIIDEHVDLLPTEDRANLDAWLKRKAALLQPGAAATGLLARMRGLSILGCGLEIGDPGPQGDGFKLKRLPEKDNEQIWALLREFAKYNIRIRIVVDDPDRLFTHQGVADVAMLAGYILGTNDISASLSYLQFVHILKGNVLEELGRVEEIDNLPADYFEHISWSKPELESMIRLRLKYAAIDESEVFDLPIADSLDILCDRIRNGPRDLLRYLEIILKSGGEVRISRASLDGQHGKFKQFARRQVRAVYDSIYEGLELFLSGVFATSQVKTITEFEDRFRSLRLESEPPGVDYGLDWLRSWERAYRALIEAGAIDLNIDGRWVRPYERDYFRRDADDVGAARATSIFR